MGLRVVIPLPLASVEDGRLSLGRGSAWSPPQKLFEIGGGSEMQFPAWKINDIINVLGSSFHVQQESFAK